MHLAVFFSVMVPETLICFCICMYMLPLYDFLDDLVICIYRYKHFLKLISILENFTSYLWTLSYSHVNILFMSTFIALRPIWTGLDHFDESFSAWKQPYVQRALSQVFSIYLRKEVVYMCLYHLAWDCMGRLLWRRLHQHTAPFCMPRLDIYAHFHNRMCVPLKFISLCIS